ncbi:TPA: NAD(P)-dependent oxidoreductase, partial [archaeon]|nr:NAD(P)-dependent oxidoreductase [Candidatus Naiadarchaeales archaeon SRR2090159.bin1288]
IFGGPQLRPNINIKDMVRAYEILLEAPAEKVNGKTFNAGYQNYSVEKIANIVKDTIGDEKIVLEKVPTDDIRSYHISSEKMKRELGFEAEHTIEDAVQSLADAYKKGLIKNGLENPMYYNIKRMKEVKLK